MVGWGMRESPTLISAQTSPATAYYLVYSKTIIEWLLYAKYQVGKDTVKLKKGIKTKNCTN